MLRPFLLHPGRRAFSTSITSTSQIPLSRPVYMIWSPNTSIGKTLISTGLAYSFLLHATQAVNNRHFLYFKPVQTGFPTDSDSRFVFSKITSLVNRHCSPTPLVASNTVFHASQSAANLTKENEFGFVDLNSRDEMTVTRGKELVRELICETWYAWRAATSPHLAAETESALIGDNDLLQMMEARLRNCCSKISEKSDVLCVIETAGGVTSPAPSGSLQCDLYRVFRLPGILVGDGRLGGISGTISAYESLKLRGYDVDAVIIEDHGLANDVFLSRYLENNIRVLVLPPIPQESSNDLMEWFSDSSEVFSTLRRTLLSSNLQRIIKLNHMPRFAREVLWWPFTQHKLLPDEAVTVIDSRCGENLSIYKSQNESISQEFDACASWWTQGPNATLQIELAKVLSYAAGRYGHVMFPENVHVPVLECADLLLDGVGKGWASKVFLSDNGSTAIEIALKMALRKFCLDNSILSNRNMNIVTEKNVELKVLALRGSYHGDTLGAMEVQAATPFTGFLQQPWYRGRGFFLDHPTVGMHNGVWDLSLPTGLHCEHQSFSTLDEIFDLHRDSSKLSSIYNSFIVQQLNNGLHPISSFHIGALIMEPVIHAAGGMQLVDPLFQRVLINECKSRKIPVIFDEVFTGFWRLGVETTTKLLHCMPDIACFAKLLTGGVLPLAATLASKSVFDAFVGDSKLQALLHGHSYSAHAMGCTAAAKAIKWFRDPSKNQNILPESGILCELWDMDLVKKISKLACIQRIIALGTLLALELRTESCDSGYLSSCASSLLQGLREDGIYMRPLGNVVYMICGPCTSPCVCTQLLMKLHSRLLKFNPR